MEVMQPVIIYQETNPYGSLTAYLEDDGRTIYLYLQAEQNPEFAMRAVWVKNRIPAPKSRTEDNLKDGLAPILCEEEIYPTDINPIHPEDVHFIWTEEGDGVALFHKEELIAFLPPWSGVKGFHGYSKYAKIEAITANPLGDSENGPIPARIEAARRFWEYRAEPNSWKEIQKRRLDYLESRLGTHLKYWSADGGKFPQLAIVKFQHPKDPSIFLYCTLGMSAQNMPSVELYHKDYLEYSRIELVFAVKTTESDQTESWIPHALGEYIKFPWTMNKWLGQGHSIALSRRDPEALYLNFTHLFLSESFPVFRSESMELDLPISQGLESEKGQPIRFLYILPITEEEVFYIRNQGSKAFLQLMEPFGTGWVHNSERESFL